MIENFLKVLRVLKESVSEESPVYLDGSQIGLINKNCSEDELNDFIECIQDYMTNNVEQKITEDYQFLLESECPKNPFITNFYKISTYDFDNLGKPILTFIQDISILENNDNVIICSEDDFLLHFHNKEENNSLKVICQETPDLEDVGDFNIKSFKTVTKPTKEEHEHTFEHDTTFFDILTDLAKKMLESGNKEPLTYYYENIIEFIADTKYNFTDFHSKNITVKNCLANINELYYNGFITKKGYFVDIEMSGYYMGIANGSDKTEMEMKLFSKNELLEYANIFPSFSKKITYIKAKDITTIIERGN